MPSKYIYHHGIPGQKWGVRRYQNEDGTLTEAGKERYGSDSVPWAKDDSRELIRSYGGYDQNHDYRSPGQRRKEALKKVTNYTDEVFGHNKRYRRLKKDANNIIGDSEYKRQKTIGRILKTAGLVGAVAFIAKHSKKSSSAKEVVSNFRNTKVTSLVSVSRSTNSYSNTANFVRFGRMGGSKWIDGSNLLGHVITRH